MSNYCQAMVICHGKSEQTICEFIKSKLRIGLEIVSNKNGALPIQITGLLAYLNQKNFKRINEFAQEYDHVQTIKRKKLNDGFKIYIIADTDDCNEREKKTHLSIRQCF